MLRAYVVAKPTKWECYLLILEFAYNSSKHISTRYSPFMLVYAFRPRAPIDVNIYYEELRNTQLSKGYVRYFAYCTSYYKNNSGQSMFLCNLVYSTIDRRYFYVCFAILRHCLLVSELNQPHGFGNLSQSSNALVHRHIVSFFLMVSKPSSFSCKSFKITSWFQR